MSDHDLLNLIFDNGRYSDGRYLNGHPRIVDYLLTLDTCYVEVLEQDYSSVRIWSSKTAYENAAKKRPILSTPIKQESPLIKELREAIESSNFIRVIEIKKRMREQGIAYDKANTKVRDLFLKQKGYK